MVEITNIPFDRIIFYFILYLGLHLGIGYYNEISQKEHKKKFNDEELRKKAVISKFLFKWFPVMYVIFVVFALYAT